MWTSGPGNNLSDSISATGQSRSLTSNMEHAIYNFLIDTISKTVTSLSFSNVKKSSLTSPPPNFSSYSFRRSVNWVRKFKNLVKLTSAPRRNPLTTHLGSSVRHFVCDQEFKSTNPLAWWLRIGRTGAHLVWSGSQTSSTSLHFNAPFPPSHG